MVLAFGDSKEGDRNKNKLELQPPLNLFENDASTTQ